MIVLAVAGIQGALLWETLTRNQIESRVCAVDCISAAFKTRSLFQVTAAFEIRMGLAQSLLCVVLT